MIRFEMRSRSPLFSDLPAFRESGAIAVSNPLGDPPALPGRQSQFDSFGRRGRAQDPSPGGVWPPSSPLGEGKCCSGRATARLEFFPLPWGEGGRGTRSGEGSFPHGGGRAPSRGQPPKSLWFAGG
jgi:hypothetical protein